MAVAEALKTESDVVFLEGIRSWPEVEWTRSQIDCKLVAVVAPLKARLERIKKRGREDDSVEHFELRDQREIEYGVAICIALADAYVLNTGTIDDALDQLDRIVWES